MISSTIPVATSEEELRSQASALLPTLKATLGDSAQGVSDATILKFLLWKPDVKRAADRFHAHQKWRKEHPFAFDSTPPLLASQDDTLRRVLEGETLVLPPGAVAKDKSTLMIGRLRNNDMSDGRTAEDVVRMILYTMDRALERESTTLHGITIFHDMANVTRNNIDPSIPKMLFSAILGHFPIRITAVYILNAPFFVRGLFQVLSLMLPSKVRKRITFVGNMAEILKYIDQDQLLEEQGGKVQDNQKEWIAQHVKRETDGTMESLAECLQPS